MSWPYMEFSPEGDEELVAVVTNVIRRGIDMTGFGGTRRYLPGATYVDAVSLNYAEPALVAPSTDVTIEGSGWRIDGALCADSDVKPGDLITWRDNRWRRVEVTS